MFAPCGFVPIWSAIVFFSNSSSSLCRFNCTTGYVGNDMIRQPFHSLFFFTWSSEESPTRCAKVVVVYLLLQWLTLCSAGSCSLQLGVHRRSGLPLESSQVQLSLRLLRRQCRDKWTIDRKGFPQNLRFQHPLIHYFAKSGLWRSESLQALPNEGSRCVGTADNLDDLLLMIRPCRRHAYRRYRLISIL